MCFCLSLCVCVYPSDGIHFVACGPHTHADSSPNGSELNKNQPWVTLGGFYGVRNSKICSNYQTAGSIGTKFGAHADLSGNGHQLKIFTHLTPIGVLWGGFRGSEIQKSGKAAKRLQRFAPNLIHTCRFIRELTLAKQKLDHRNPLGAFGGGGFMGSKIQVCERWSNCWLASSITFQGVLCWLSYQPVM